ncbi:UNVERIFIED_CONTAM: hypothetical protein FKN15_053689 [Acipenser sinensis]
MTQAEREPENGKEKEKDRDKEKEKEQRGVKRPIVPPVIPEPLQEQIQSNFIVVINPGSATLRIGRATDTLPVSIPHVIARRHKHQGQPRHEDPWLMREGLNALLVNPTDCYNIHWPIRRGQINLHGGPGGTLTAVMANLETIWSYAIQKFLEIPLRDLKAPMALFYPATFGIVGQKMTSLQQRSQGDSEDPHDEQYLMGTQSKQDQSAKATAERKTFPKPSGFDGESCSQNPEPSDRSHSQEMDLGHSQSDCLTGNEGEESPSAVMSRRTAISQFEGKALGIDKAILHSIDCCASDETKKKMYSCILVVGGGLMFHGSQEFLRHRILNKMPPSFRRVVENVEVITRPKDMDPRLIAWKGGAVLACLDTTQELWIYQREWQRFGVRMLRERAAFVW